ncbi:hypothetical protein GCM10023339_77170 [Alloalcanivorax gelatiniphagus]
MRHVAKPTAQPTRDTGGKNAGSDVPGWLPVLLMGVFLAAAARQGVRVISDPDAFWHLRLGHDIIDARSVSSITGPWSSLSDQPWVPTQWLSEVLLALAEDVGGLPAVALLFTTTLLVLVLLVHRLARRVADPVPAAFATGLTVLAMSASLSPRPHMVTYVLLCATLAAWLRTADDLRPRWWLVPLTWIWAMSHGMWFIGPVVGLTVLAGLCLDRRVERADALRLLAIPVASAVSAALTPVGPGLLGAPLAVAGVGAYITEWQPPSFREPGPAAAALMVGLVVVVWGRSTRQVAWTHVALLVLAAGWVVLATRTVALGALIVAPLAAGVLQELLHRDHRSPERRETWSLWLIALAVACISAFVVPGSAADPARVPSGLNGQLDDLADGSVVYNAYELGGWLRWRHPDLEPVVDGMTEAYSVAHLGDFGRVQAVAAEWQGTFDGWRPAAALVLDRSPLATALTEQRGWTSVAEDGGYVLLVPSP